MSLFLIIFSILLIVANIYCFISKKYLYLFIPCMLFLPEYYGIDISGSLPVITVTRIMFVIFYIYVFINKKRNISFSELKTMDVKSIPKEYMLLAIYFIFRIIPNLCYITTFGQAAKTLFSIIFEQTFLLIAIYLLAPDKKEIDTLIKVVVYTAAAFYIIGIFESMTYIRPFDALYTVSRTMLNEHYVRLGLLRATATFGMPINYGNMCLFTLPLIMYMYEISRHKRYLFIALLNVMAMIHSGSRSDFIFYGFILIVYFVFVAKGLQRKILYIRNCLIVLLGLLIAIFAISWDSQYYTYFYTGTVKSVLNEVGFDFDLSEGSPDGAEGFGENADYGSGSRLAQFTGIEYTLKTSPIIGLGSKAQTRGDVQYYSRGYWHPSYTYDVGYVEIFCDEGIIGMIGYICLFAAMVLSAVKKSEQSCLIDKKYLLLFVVTYMVGMLSTANMFGFLMVYVVFCVFARNCTDQ